MTINYNPILTDSEYKGGRYDVILWLEEGGVEQLPPYTDNANGGYATIGAGFRIDLNWDAILTAMGFDTTDSAPAAEKTYIALIKNLIPTNSIFTASQIETLKTQLNTLMVARAADTNYPSTFPYTRRDTFAFTDAAEVQTTFNAIVDATKGYEETLSKLLGETTRYSIVPQSYERMALLSRSYNSGTLNSDIVKALKDGDRAEAWYWMRYSGYTAKNPQGQSVEMPGLVKRRFAEAEFLGLYDNPDSVTLTEAQQVYRMLQKHRTDIADKEAKYGVAMDGTRGTVLDGNGRTALEAANQDYSTIKNAYLNDGTIDTLESSLNKAKIAILTDLRSQYANNPDMQNKLQDSSFKSTDIYLNPSKPTDNYRTSVMSVSLFSINHDSLMIGMDQTDIMFGGSGNDVLIGNEGNDYLSGGKGDDVLVGGAGFDTYIVDGNDRIIDSDGNGIVKDKNGQEIVGAFIKQADGSYVWANNPQVTATKNSPLTLA